MAEYIARTRFNIAHRKFYGEQQKQKKKWVAIYEENQEKEEKKMVEMGNEIKHHKSQSMKCILIVFMHAWTALH